MRYSTKRWKSTWKLWALAPKETEVQPVHRGILAKMELALFYSGVMKRSSSFSRNIQWGQRGTPGWLVPL